MPKLSESHDHRPAPTRRASTPKVRQRAEQQRSHDTRAALITTARRLFAEQGYHATGTGEIVELAQVTRGALYHHFNNKEDLFEAVYRQAERELTQEAQAATLAMQGQTSRRVIGSLDAYLKLLASRHDLQRILLVDGPAVLGWERWSAIRSEYELASWSRTLALLIEHGQMVPAPIEPIAQIIMSAINGAILAVAHATDPETRLDEMAQALTLLIGGLMRKDTRPSATDHAST